MAAETFDALKERARGRWIDILASVGIETKYLAGKHSPCPMCGGTDRFRWIKKSERWVCNSCRPETGDGFDLVGSYKRVNAKGAMTLVREAVGTARAVKLPVPNVAKQRAELNALWDRATVIASGDPVDLYLKRRGLPRPDARYIRTVEKLEFHEGGEVSCHWGMLAKMLGPDGKPSNIHRTFLTNDGRKAAGTRRKMCPGPMAKGGAVRCIPMIDGNGTLGIAEGIETALSAFKLTGIPTWAALNAQALESWVPPPEATTVIIFGDSDKSYTGQAAAYALAKRLTLIDKIDAEVALPWYGEPIDKDWNDVLMWRDKGNALQQRGEAEGPEAGA